MIVYRVEIEVPGARELDAVRHALAEMELDRGALEHSGVSSRGGSTIVTADLEARTPVTAASSLFAIVAGASHWRMEEASVRVAPASSATWDTPARAATHTR